MDLRRGSGLEREAWSAGAVGSGAYNGDYELLADALAGDGKGGGCDCAGSAKRDHGSRVRRRVGRFLGRHGQGWPCPWPVIATTAAMGETKRRKYLIISSFSYQVKGAMNNAFMGQ